MKNQTRKNVCVLLVMTPTQKQQIKGESMPTKINQRSTDLDEAESVNHSPRDKKLDVTYYPDLEQLIRECEERAARQAQLNVNKNQPMRPPYGFD